MTIGKFGKVLTAGAVGLCVWTSSTTRADTGFAPFPQDTLGFESAAIAVGNYNMNQGLHFGDGNLKHIAASGDFVVNGERLGRGQWVTPVRYVVHVSAWGGRFWVGDLTPRGILSTTTASFADALRATPDNDEPWTSDADFAIDGEVRINEASHSKVITSDGDFWVDGSKLGSGFWTTPTRFMVHVPQWGNVWWVGELNEEGMSTGVSDTFFAALSMKPGVLESWTTYVPFARVSDVMFSDGNAKIIRSNGDFFVNGEKLGRGYWASPVRFVVFVESFGNVWWIGDLTSEGVLTTVTETAGIADASPDFLEPYMR